MFARDLVQGARVVRGAAGPATVASVEHHAHSVVVVFTESHPVWGDRDHAHPLRTYDTL